MCDSQNISSLWGNPKSLDLESVPRSSGNNLARSEVELTWTIGKRRAIIVNIADKMPTGGALELGPFTLDSPIVESLEEWTELVLFLETELGGVDEWKRKGSLVSGLEIEIRREEMTGIEIEICSAFWTGIDGSHCWRERISEALWRERDLVTGFESPRTGTGIVQTYTPSLIRRLKEGSEMQNHGQRCELGSGLLCCKFQLLFFAGILFLFFLLYIFKWAKKWNYFKK